MGSEDGGNRGQYRGYRVAELSSCQVRFGSLWFLSASTLNCLADRSIDFSLLRLQGPRLRQVSISISISIVNFSFSFMLSTFLATTTYELYREDIWSAEERRWCNCKQTAGNSESKNALLCFESISPALELQQRIESA